MFLAGKHQVQPRINESLGIRFIVKIDLLVGGLEHFLFFHILGIIIPTDFHIFLGAGIPPTSL